MTAITIRSFGGMNPITTAKNLPDNAAQVSTNTYLSKGSIKPWKGGATVVATSGGTVKSIHRYGDTAVDNQYWFEFTEDVDVQKGPISSDQWKRIYFTGKDYPRYTLTGVGNVTAPYPTASYKLGVPVPMLAPVATVSGDATDPNDLVETRIYVYTYVTAYGEEGVPSDASLQADLRPGQTVTLTSLSSAPSGNYNITKKRIYRSNTGSSGSAIYQFVAEIDVGVTTFVDTVANGDLSEENASGNYDMPDANMVGITGIANGMLAGFFDNTVCISEPFLPHAWPLEYRLSTEHKIVGIGAFAQSLAVLTESYPYVATGVDPSSMSMEKLPLQQACVSKRSIVEMGEGVIYASPDGLFSIGSGGISNITQNLFTREEWQSYNPSSILGCQYDGRYFAFYDTGSVKGCLLFSFNGVEPTFCTLDIHATAAYNDPLNDTLFLVINGNIVKFNYGSALTYKWRSKNFLLVQPQNLGAAQVLAKGYPLTFRLYCDGSLKHTQTVASVAPFRLPSGFLATELEFEVEGTTEIEQVSLASSMSELRSV